MKEIEITVFTQSAIQGSDPKPLPWKLTLSQGVGWAACPHPNDPECQTLLYTLGTQFTVPDTYEDTLELLAELESWS